jgi:hypothetical protein
MLCVVHLMYAEPPKPAPEKIKDNDAPYSAGQKVRYEKFGIGFVVSCAGEGEK